MFPRQHVFIYQQGELNKKAGLGESLSQIIIINICFVECFVIQTAYLIFSNWLKTCLKIIKIFKAQYIEKNVQYNLLRQRCLESTIIYKSPPKKAPQRPYMFMRNTHTRARAHTVEWLERELSKHQSVVQISPWLIYQEGDLMLSVGGGGAILACSIFGK